MWLCLVLVLRRISDRWVEKTTGDILFWICTMMWALLPTEFREDEGFFDTPILWMFAAECAAHVVLICSAVIKYYCCCPDL